MTRLYRPYIPVEVKCRVILRQLGMFPAIIEMLIEDYRKLRNLGGLLKGRMGDLADLLGCEIAELRLDHDPPLALRPKERRGLGKKTYYVPDANDPEHLVYRPHGAQHEGSHDVKTRIRGDHGQHSDLALIRIEKRRAAKKVKKKRRVWRSRPLTQGKTVWPKRSFAKRRKT